MSADLGTPVSQLYQMNAISGAEGGETEGGPMWGRFFDSIGAATRLYGVGSLAEIYDGDAPFAPRGCIAQAWSVGEALRAWTELSRAQKRVDKETTLTGKTAFPV